MLYVLSLATWHWEQAGLESQQCVGDARRCTSDGSCLFVNCDTKCRKAFSTFSSGISDKEVKEPGGSAPAFLEHGVGTSTE